MAVILAGVVLITLAKARAPAASTATTERVATREAADEPVA